MDPFTTADDVRAFAVSVIEAEAGRTNTEITEFDRKLLALSSEDVRNARYALAEAYGVEDSGWGAIRKLTNLLRQAHKDSTLSFQHPSGMRLAALLTIAETRLDSTRDLLWLMVHDARSDLSPRAQTVVGKIGFAVIGLLVLAWIAWRALGIGGTKLAVGIGFILLVAFAIDRYRLARAARV